MTPSHRSKRSHHASNHRGEFDIKEIESLFTRHVFKVIGILFLGASLWFAASSADLLFRIYTELQTPTSLLSAPAETILSTGDLPQPSSISPEVNSRSTTQVILFFVLLSILWLGLQLLTRWRKRGEYQIVSVFLVFVSLLAFVRFYSWHVEWLFPFLLILSVGYFFFGRHLSHTGTRLHFVFTWGLLLFWWLITIMIRTNENNLLPFVIYSSLFFFAFHLIQLFHGFAGGKRLSRLYEQLAIGANLLIYYATMGLTIIKFGRPEELFYLTLALAVIYFLSLWMMDAFKRRYRKEPFVFSLLFLCSLLLPLLVRINQFILFTGSLSVLLMFFSRQTRNQPAILLSLGLLAAMILWYAKGWVLTYFPAAFLGSIAFTPALYLKGVTAGLAVTLAAWANHRMMARLHVRFSREWFSRRRYRSLLMIVSLTGLYTTLLWSVQFACDRICSGVPVLIMSWFTFHLLFTMVAIPWLAIRRSSLLTPVILTSMLLTILYPTLLTMEFVQLLGLFLRDVPYGVILFPLHYIPSALFLLYISIVLIYGQRSFRGNTWSKRLLLIYAVVMVLVVLTVEMVLTGVALTSTSSAEAVVHQKKLIQLPLSLVIAGEAIVLLVWGLLLRKRFARLLALLLLVAAAGKVIAYDLPGIPMLTRILLLFVTGFLFLAISIFYQQLRKVGRHNRRPSRKE